MKATIIQLTGKVVFGIAIVIIDRNQTTLYLVIYFMILSISQKQYKMKSCIISFITLFLHFNLIFSRLCEFFIFFEVCENVLVRYSMLFRQFRLIMHYNFVEILCNNIMKLFFAQHTILSFTILYKTIDNILILRVIGLCKKTMKIWNRGIGWFLSVYIM